MLLLQADVKRTDMYNVIEVVESSDDGNMKEVKLKW